MNFERLKKKIGVLNGYLYFKKGTFRKAFTYLQEALNFKAKNCGCGIVCEDGCSGILLSDNVTANIFSISVKEDALDFQLKKTRSQLYQDFYTKSASFYTLSNVSEDNVLEVVRSSDDAIKDFNYLDILNGNLLSWVGAGNSGYVKTWYDSGPLGLHAVQPDPLLRPLIVKDGELCRTQNGMPGIYFFDDQTTGVGPHLIAPVFYDPADKDIAITSVFEYEDGDGFFPHIYASGDNQNEGPIIITSQSTEILTGHIRRTTGTTSRTSSLKNTMVIPDKTHVRIDTFGRLGDYNTYFDGQLDTSIPDNIDSDITVPPSGEFWIGSADFGVIRNNMYISELHLYRENINSVVPNIFSDLSKVYGLTTP